MIPALPPVLTRAYSRVEAATLPIRASPLIYFGAIFLLCLSLLVIGFRISSETNHDPEAFDQSAYILLANKLADSAYPRYSDGTRNPLFPWLAVQILDPSDPGFLEAGKKLNIVLVGLGTALLGAFFRRRMGPLAAFNTTAMAALAVLLPLGSFFGAEVLFFVLFLFVFAAALRLLSTNPLWLYALLGLLAALAYLAKPSGTPFLVLFVGFSFLRLIIAVLPSSWLPAAWAWSASAWKVKNFFLGIALFGAIYFALISPRLIHAQQTWGAAFYSLPGFWFWADDWETCVQKYSDCRAVTLARLAPEEQPTMAGYFLRHDINDAIARVTHGTGVRLQQFFHPEKKWRFPYEKRGKPKRIVLPHRGFYIIGLFALGVVLGGCVLARGRLPALGPVALPLLLAIATCVLYTLAMGWYLPTGPGHRFILTLYLPILWVLAQGGDELRRAASSRPADALFLIAHISISVLLISRVAILLVSGHFEKITYAF